MGVRVSLRVFAAAAGLLVLGVILIIGGWWVRPIAQAEDAVGAGRLESALEHYAAAESRFDAVPGSKRFIPRLYDLVLSNELSVMYSLKQYDSVIDKAGATDSAGGKFWAGCALFVKADLENLEGRRGADKRLSWLSQAQQQFRDAINASPTNFDAKFNFEITSKLIASVKKDPNVEIPKDLKLLTPSSAQAPKKIG